MPHYEYIDPSTIIKRGPDPDEAQDQHIAEMHVNVEHVYEIIRCSIGPEAL